MIIKDKASIGFIGEKLALRYIRKSGFKILATNFKRLPWGEIDIIGKKRNTVFFFEVKATGDLNSAFLPEQKINKKKKIALRRVIQIYLSENHLRLDSFWQVDAIIVRIDFYAKKYHVKHLKNIFYQ